METVTLPPSYWITITPDNNILITSPDKQHQALYNPKYINIKGSNQTQNTILSTFYKTPNNLETELKQLDNLRLLKRKLLTTETQHQKYTYAKKTNDEDQQILTQRRLNKSLTLVHKYLAQLKQDTNFSISRNNGNIVIEYLGTYVNARSVAPFVEGVTV